MSWCHKRLPSLWPGRTRPKPYWTSRPSASLHVITVGVLCLQWGIASFTSMLAMTDCACSFISRYITGNNLATIELLAGENKLSRSLSIHANSRATNRDRRNQICCPSLFNFSRQVLTNLVESCLATDGIFVASVRTAIFVKRWISRESAKASSLCNSTSSSEGSCLLKGKVSWLISASSSIQSPVSWARRFQSSSHKPQAHPVHHHWRWRRPLGLHAHTTQICTGDLIDISLVGAVVTFWSLWSVFISRRIICQKSGFQQWKTFVSKLGSLGRISWCLIICMFLSMWGLQRHPLQLLWKRLQLKGQVGALARPPLLIARRPLLGAQLHTCGLV